MPSSAVQGEWIEMEAAAPEAEVLRRRSPYGERGLKYLWRQQHPEGRKSLPVRGAWIEIHRPYPYKHSIPVAPRTGSVD